MPSSPPADSVMEIASGLPTSGRTTVSSIARAAAASLIAEAKLGFDALQAQELLDLAGRLGADGKPVLDAILIDRNGRRFGLRVVATNDFQDAAVARGALIGGDNVLDEDAPDRACKASTIKMRRTYLRLAASAARATASVTNSIGSASATK